jgi:hypothetical protein
MSKKIIINEEQAAIIVKSEIPAIFAGPRYTINPDKVMIVKRYLDSNFKRGKMEEIGEDGFPKITPIIAMLSSTGQVLKNLLFDQCKELLIDKYKKMFVNDDERDKFLGQVMKDWYDNKIGLYGSLSVNHL